jgi:transposase-like protein
MKVYQKEKASVKDAVQIVDPDILLKMAEEGLLGLATEIGIEAMSQIFEHEATQLAGAKGRHDKRRTAYRHGTERTKVVLGGAKVSATRPRIRTRDNGSEIPLESLAVFQREDQLSQSVLAAVLSGVSCRKYARTVNTEADACTSKSEVSRRFIAAMKAAMNGFFGRRIEDSFPVVMIDGMALGKNTVVAAMGIGADGRKLMLGVVEGGSENSQVVKTLLEDLTERGLDQNEPRLFVLDGSKALAKAVKDTFGGKAVIQRCQIHKKRNVLAHLPESEKGRVGKAVSLAYMEHDEAEARRRLDLLERELRMRYPAAADSLHEGLEETLTVHKLKAPGLLRQTLASTNAIESANSVCAGVIRRVTRFKTGEAAIRQAAAGYMEAERGFRRIKGYRELPLLQAALARLTNTTSKDRIGVA